MQVSSAHPFQEQNVPQQMPLAFNAGEIPNGPTL